MTDREILEDIRLRLKGLGVSKLHGDRGLVQVTMDAWSEACEDADKGWKRVRDLESALHKIAAIAIQDVDREFVWLTLDKIASIAKESIA